MLTGLLEHIEESSVKLSLEGIHGFARSKSNNYPTPFILYFDKENGELSPRVTALVNKCFKDFRNTSRSKLIELISELASVKGMTKIGQRIEWRPRE